MKNKLNHAKEVKAIAEQIKKYSQSDNTKKLRFFHGDSNSTRSENKDKYFWINISDLNSILEVNKKEAYAIVEPNVPMDTLVSRTLQFGMIPQVVMEFPGITCGGGVNGAALESSSFKFGQFNDICLEYEIILGNGQIVIASEKEHPELFYGISSSYGSIGLITAIKIKLIPSHVYVQTTYYPCKSYKKTLAFLKKQTTNRNNDFLEGIIYDKHNAVVITGRFIDEGRAPVQTFSKATDPWFYEHAKKATQKQETIVELVPLVDYLFRYNRGAFWVGELAFPYLHVPSNRLTKFIFNPFMNTRKLHDGMVAVNHSQDFFVQDFYAPYEASLDLITYAEKKLAIFPIWLCPIKPAKTMQKLSPHFIKDSMLLDIGIWGKTEEYLSNPIKVNKDVEQYLVKHKIRKMFYAHVYYEQNDFWNIYDKKWYDALRKKYFAENVFPNIWQKVFVSEVYKVRKLQGALTLLKDTFLHGKHLNT